VGISSADTVIAINRDERAAIFDLARWGIVGDYFEVVPSLIKKLKASGK
jgi:electron transfer flavoprotein alpha subunit